MRLSDITKWFRRQPRERQILLALIDVFINWRTGGEFGETLSERWAKEAAAGDPRAKAICLILDQADPGHCARAAGD